MVLFLQKGKVKGWMDDLQFMAFSTVFHSDQVSGRVTHFEVWPMSLILNVIFALEGTL